MTGQLDRPLTNERHRSLLTVACTLLDVCVHIQIGCVYTYSWTSTVAGNIMYMHVIQKGACSYGGPLCVAENIVCLEELACLYYALTVAGMNMCIYMYVYIHVHNVCNIHMYMYM